jgi:hypothetical protein
MDNSCKNKRESEFSIIHTQNNPDGFNFEMPAEDFPEEGTSVNNKLGDALNILDECD